MIDQYFQFNCQFNIFNQQRENIACVELKGNSDHQGKNQILPMSIG